MINPIQATEQKIFNEQYTSRTLPTQTPSMRENGVDSSANPTTYVERKDKVELNYDVNRYVQILKNMVVPPEDRFDASILLELELDGKITAQELRDMISEVQRKDIRKENTKVEPVASDDDSRGKEA